MKKIVTILIAFVMLAPLALVGCGKKSNKAMVSGLYVDDELVASWSQIVEAFPDSFEDDGKTIKCLDYHFLEQFIDGYQEKEGIKGKVTFVIDGSVTKIEGDFLSNVKIDEIKIPSSITECEGNPFSSIKECNVVIDSAAVFSKLSIDNSLYYIYVLKSIVDDPKNANAEFLSSKDEHRQYWKRYNGADEYKNYYLFKYTK